MQLASDTNDDRNLQTALTKAGPLFDAEFSDLMGAVGPFESAPVIAVAVSGGPDSLTLTLLASRWAISHGGRAVGLVVDHGLRTTSASRQVRG